MAPSVSRGIRISARSWQRVGSGLTWVAIAALVAVALGELDRLIASVPAGDGRSHPLNVVLSPVALAKFDSWEWWARAVLNEQLGGWIAASALLDLVLMLALAVLIRRLIDLAYRSNRRVPGLALILYVVAEVVENGFQLAGGWIVQAGNVEIARALGSVVAGATTVKALALFVIVLAVLRIAPYRAVLARRIARIGQALWVHRLATLAILVIVVLSCIPAADLLDQLPDVQRQWADDDGPWHFVWAVLALLSTAVVTFVLGRRRTRFLVETRALRLQRRQPTSWWVAARPWALAPAALLFAAVAVGLGTVVTGASLDGVIHPLTFSTMFALVVAVPIAAAICWRWTAENPEALLPLDPLRARASWIVGDGLAVLVLVAGGIGLVRSFMVAFALGSAGGVEATKYWAWVIVPLGAAVAAFAPVLILPRLGELKRGSTELDPNERVSAADNGEQFVSRPGPVEYWSLAGAIVFLIAAMLAPRQIAQALGGVAATLVAITAWVMVFGAFTLIVQSWVLIAPFRWFRLKAAPVLTLGLLLPLAVNVIISSTPAADRALHAVHVSNDDPARATGVEKLDARLTELQRDHDCALPVAVDGRKIDVRPVYLIAAEGGGIRAAFWTATALATLEGCSAESGFVANGISGGSVGLAVASTIDDAPSEPNDNAEPRPKDATELAAQDRAKEIVARVKDTAGPDVVSTVVLGLAVGDAFAAGSGVHVPSYLDAAESADDNGWRWRDRAALAEAIWEHQAPGLAAAFSDEIDPLTGMLMLSSTDVVTKCRLLVDQVAILAPADRSGGASPPTTTGGACDSSGRLPSMLGFRELPASGDSDTADCLASLDWSTAVMLSARFAIVTPTGGLPAVKPCDGAEGAQFVDGGYVEPTALAALADTAPMLMTMIAEKNSTKATDDPWLVPTLLYLRNTQGYDLAEDVAHTESEPLVPLTGGAARINLTAEDAWIQRITLTMPQACPGGAVAEECRAALSALIAAGGPLPGGTVVVAPGSTPAVVPPLGWALSEMSQARFTTAMAAAAGCTDPTLGASKPIAGGDVDLSAHPARYLGLKEFAEFIPDFDPCGQLTAQEESRGASESAE